MKVLRKPNYSKPNCGSTEYLIYYIIVIGLSLLAQQLLKKKPKSPVQDDKPTTLTIRGSYTTWICGIRMVGPVFAWAGDRFKRKESVGGGKGGDSPKQDVWYESGWHLLSVGPCDALHKIIDGGRVIFDGPITRTSHPSGSTIDLGSEGVFEIYWGEDTQPINTFLGDPSRVGVSSRWPNCCYILWREKRLGATAFWGKIDYEIERRPTNSILTGSNAWYEPTPTLTGDTYDIVAVVASAGPDVGYLQVAGDLTQEIDVGQPIQVSGNGGLADGQYQVRRTAVDLVIVGFRTDPEGNTYPIYETRTNVFLETGTAGATVSGEIETFTFALDNGANIGHAVAELLFAPFPHGLGLDTGDPEPWDIPSLEAWGAEAETDEWRSSLVCVDGETAEAVFANALQDHGVLLPFDTETGFLLFNRVREPVGTLPLLTFDMETDELPEIESYHGERRVDRMVFTFSQRGHGYADMTIGEDEDGQISYTEYARARSVPISSTCHFNTAAKLTELRAQEELASVGGFKLPSVRGARTFIPGDSFVSDQFDEVLRVINVGHDPLSETVNLTVIPDFLGVRKSDYIANPGGGSVTILDPEVNPEAAYAEIPEQLLSFEKMFLLALNIRANNQVSHSIVFISRDDTTYTQKNPESGFCAGGKLDVALTATGKSFLANGPTFTIEGPDLGGVMDLSADPTNFGLGRQLAVIVSNGGIEICYVEKITSLSATQARLDGLMRARYDTRKIAHGVGSAVFIFPNDALTEISDILLLPDEDLYMKAQPVSMGGTISLSAVPPFGARLRGKGLRPIDVEGLRCTAPFQSSAAYRTGDDVTVRWSWSSSTAKGTGAGYQNAGAAVGTPPLKGSFFVELLTSADVLVSSQSVTTPQVTYAAATLAAAPISNGNFKVRVTHQYNGYLALPVTLSVTHVT